MNHMNVFAQICKVYLIVFISRDVTAQLPIRLCVPEILDHECISMRQDVGKDKIQCIFARDRLHCMEKIERNSADLVSVDASDVYTAGKQFKLAAYVMEEVKRSNFLYEACAVIKKNSDINSLRDLKRKNSCHTGWGRTAGWNVPIGILLEQAVMEPDCRGELHTVSQFFNSSCVAGPWSPSIILDTKFKQDHPSLCSLCDDPLSCSTKDSYGGYQGTLKCLTEGRGDIAFTKHEAVQEFLKKNPREINNLQYLCLNGTRKNMHDTPCCWAQKPTNVFMGATDKLADSQSSFHRTLSQIFNDYKGGQQSWFQKVLVSSLDTTDFLIVPPKRQSWIDYLGNYKNAIERELRNCGNKTITFCTASAVELNKCRDFAMSAYSRQVRPNIGCSLETSHEACIKSVANRKADLITLDAGDIYRAGRDHGLKPIAQEIYGQMESSYFAVAVINEKSKINELSDLKGKRSCHPRISHTSGWIIPIATLLKEELIPENICNRLASASNFFSASCLPGANETEFNENETIAEILCKQCIGNDQEENRCTPDSDERYSGEIGSFRCLAEGKGDVAFLSHTVPLDLTDGKSRFSWTARLHSRNFRLLCRHGSTASLQEYETCHLARLPSRHVMISEKAAEEVIIDASQLLGLSAKAFGSTSKSLTFKLFGSYQLIPDLLFKDKTTDLQAVMLNATYESVLGDTFNEAMKVIDPEKCQPVGSATKIFLSPIIFFIMLNILY